MGSELREQAAGLAPRLRKIHQTEPLNVIREQLIREQLIGGQLIGGQPGAETV